jgi:hypothetical protein
LVAVAGRIDSFPASSFGMQISNWQSEQFATILVDLCRACDGTPQQLMAKIRLQMQNNRARKIQILQQRQYL